MIHSLLKRTRPQATRRRSHVHVARGFLAALAIIGNACGFLLFVALFAGGAVLTIAFLVEVLLW